uniref:Uncharacterized protein n=1 Tax=Rhizophora mucronata TaxID=61149 RepID=A0A2P2Q1L6_RHIMU
MSRLVKENTFQFRMPLYSLPSTGIV